MDSKDEGLLLFNAGHTNLTPGASSDKSVGDFGGLQDASCRHPPDLRSWPT